MEIQEIQLILTKSIRVLPMDFIPRTKEQQKEYHISQLKTVTTVCHCKLNRIKNWPRQINFQKRVAIAILLRNN